MTDNEIIKALEHCSDNGECKDCPANPHIGNCGCCINGLMKRAHDLINRQKAEIERFNNSPILTKLCPMWKAEAIREFAERLTMEVCESEHITINNLAKEMTEGGGRP